MANTKETQWEGQTLCVCASEELFNVLPMYLIITAVALTSRRLIAGIMNIYINNVIVTS